MQHIEKYHGLGNDFILVEGSTWDESLGSDDAWLGRVQRLCDRHRGVGADGVILCHLERDGAVRMLIFNRDGSRPEMCGNGVRCAVVWAATRGHAPQGHIVIRSDAGDRMCHIKKRGSQPADLWDITVGMGTATLVAQPREVNLAGEALQVWDVDMGNPHAVSLAGIPEDLSLIDAMGAQANGLRQEFPQGVNVEFVAHEADHVYRAVVYERGVGRTQACGTGACAVAAALWASGEVADGVAVEVHLPGGPLSIERRGDAQVWMTGPAAHVFTGRINTPLW